MIWIVLTITGLLATAIYMFMQQPPFGKVPTGERLIRIQQSPHYKNGQFQNESLTPALTEGANYFNILFKFILGRNKNGKPQDRIPHQKTNLLKLRADENVLVWFGHSSYFIQLNGKKILVDPVLSGNASPLSFTTRSFTGSDAYTAEDIPSIDYLFITHDHWDHLDYPTLQALQPKIKKL